jgi:hypothetical protein
LGRLDRVFHALSHQLLEGARENVDADRGARSLALQRIFGRSDSRENLRLPRKPLTQSLLEIA